jgi:hypothetical protein
LSAKVIIRSECAIVLHKVQQKDWLQAGGDKEKETLEGVPGHPFELFT